MIKVEQIPSELWKFLKAWEKPYEKSLFLLKSIVIDFEIHYKKYAPLRLLLYYITITCQKSGFALFL